jgi:hypothetical protein
MLVAIGVTFDPSPGGELGPGDRVACAAIMRRMDGFGAARTTICGGRVGDRDSRSDAGRPIRVAR